jgi:hypothetical protein
MAEKTKTTNTITLAGIELGVFFTLFIEKLNGTVTFSWLWVFSPIWIPWAIIIFIVLAIMLYHFIMNVGR